MRMTTMSKGLTALVMTATAGMLLAGCGGDGAATKPTVTARTGQKDRNESSNGGAAQSGDNGGAAVAEGFGHVRGVVRFDGPRPEQRLLISAGEKNRQDAAVCAAMDVPDETLLVGSGGGVKNVFVYLTRAPRGAEVAPVPQEPEKFDQKFCMFKPHAMIVRAGQTLLVLNDDGVLHNTNNSPRRSEKLNAGVSPNNRQGIPYTYEAAEDVPVSVKCDIHAWMNAWHLPLDHQFAGLTDEEGVFEIRDLPAGTHEFRVWHEKGGLLDRAYKVTIKPDETTEVELSFAPGKFAAADPQTKTIHLSSLR